ncbi:hypothetical protein QBC40DRAFT_172349, partial [Triangularia verruculosa]
HDWNRILEVLKMLVGLQPWLANAKCRRAGHTILMRIAAHSCTKPEFFKSVLDFLLEGRSVVDLESADKWGCTAAVLAIESRSSSVEYLRLLIQARASLTSVHDYGNILHSAAQYASIEMLEFLRTRDIVVDWKLQSRKRGWTAWDEFRWRMTGDDIQLLEYGNTRPSVAEAHTFALLYSEVRDRCLQQEHDFLEAVAGCSRGGEMVGNLEILRDWYEEMGCEADLGTVIVVENQIRNGMLDAAHETLVDKMADCRLHMRRSPWMYGSVIDPDEDKEDYQDAYKQFDDLLFEKFGTEAHFFGVGKPSEGRSEEEGGGMEEGRGGEEGGNEEQEGGL